MKGSKERKGEREGDVRGRKERGREEKETSEEKET